MTTVRVIAEQRGCSVLDLLPTLGELAAEDLCVHRKDHYLNEIGHAAAALASVEFCGMQMRDDIDPFVDLTSSRSFEEPHLLDGNLPRYWPETFAEAVQTNPENFSFSTGRSSGQRKSFR